MCMEIFQVMTPERTTKKKKHKKQEIEYSLLIMDIMGQ